MSIFVSEYLSFSVNAAVKIGLNAAIVLQYIIKSRGVYREGKFWSCFNRSGFKKVFPFLSKEEIVDALVKLKREEYIEVRRDFGGDEWYALTDKAEDLL